MLMGESLVENPTLEEKMGDPMTNVGCLQESVSFGRFEHDSLCWERWSTFPTNKYLEEVEKCSTPGSVAQKKAYFEAHYKRIAARKSELMDQDKNREIESLGSEDLSQNLMDSGYSSSGDEVEIKKSVTHNPFNGTELETESMDFIQEIDVPIDDVGFIGEENKVSTFSGEAGEEAHFDVSTVEENEVADVKPEMCERIEDVCEEKHIQPQPEVATQHLCPEEKIIELKPEETVFVKEEAASTLASQDEVEDNALPHLEAKEMVKKETEEVVITETPKNIEKLTPKMINSMNAKKKIVTPMSKGSAAQMPKKPATPAPKTPVSSIPKLSKPVQSRTAMSATRPSAKEENGLTPLLATKKATKPENKRMGPASLHMSLSVAPGNSDPTALTTRRKSLIMESMGDKDIVKRAFKAFEKSNLLSNASLSRSPATSQPVTRKTEHKGSGPATLQKKNEGISRSVKRAGSCSDQGTVKPSFLTGLRKNTAVDQRNGKSIPSFGSRSLNLGNKPREISKKPEQKSMTKEIGRAHTPSKVTMEKSVEIRTVRSTNSKANLSSSWNQGRVSKLLLKKGGKASD